VDPLRYQEPSASAPDAFGDEVLTVKLRMKEPDGDTSRLLVYPVEDPGNVALHAASRDFQFASAVAAFGMLLRDSEHRGQASFPLVREIAHSALGEDPGGYRRGFLDLCGRAAMLSGGVARLRGINEAQADAPGLAHVPPCSGRLFHLTPGRGEGEAEKAGGGSGERIRPPA
jgi:hypothetical protein